MTVAPEAPARLPRTTLVERGAQLAELHAFLADAAAGRGRLAMLRGEAGIGKSALLQAFLASAEDGTAIHIGACDGVSTPRPFSPLHEMVGGLGPELGELLGSAAPRLQVCEWMISRLSTSQPTVLAVEDVQWADDATLDLLVYLGRRLSKTGTLLVATYREGEASPPAGMLGALATMPGVRHIMLPVLTAAGVAEMAAGSQLDASALHDLSGGNPFFVAEVVAAGEAIVPVSVGDSIRGRVARLDDAARYALDAAAVIGNRPEPWLLAAVAGEKVLGIDDCLAAGLIRKSEGMLAFRHELTRMAVIEDLPVIRGIGLHRRALDALERSGATDHARLAYHAEGAADATRVLAHARPAADLALRTGAYREAIQQLERVLRFAEALPDGDHADILEALSYALFLVNRQQEAYDLRVEALGLRRRVGDPLREGDCLRWLSRLAWIRGRAAEDHELAMAAVDVLEPLGDTHELRMAVSNVAALHMIHQRNEEALEWGERALRMGRRANDPEVIAHALNNVGSTRLNLGDERGRAMLLESAAISRENRFPEHLDRALYNLAGAALGQRDLPTAERTIRELIDWTSRTELERCSLEAMLSDVMVEAGRFDEAEGLASKSVALDRTDPQDRCQALLALARVRMRRGQPADQLLDEAWQHAATLGSLGVRWPAAAARAELAWLQGDMAGCVGELREVYELARLRSDRWAIGDVGRWLWRAGELSELDPRAAEPYTLQVGGEWRAAAGEWEARGIPYEAALCLADSTDPTDLREALSRLEALGAPAAARRVTGRLRQMGARIPRGPRSATRRHPAGLTEREAEVAALAAGGLTNREIAERLVLTEKTVAHHVSAVLGKLGARRRADIGPVLSGDRGTPEQFAG